MSMELSSLVTCKKLRIASNVLLMSFDSERSVFVPFESLSDACQQAVCKAVKVDVEELLEASGGKEHRPGMFMVKRSKFYAKKQDTIDSLLKVSFPFVFQANSSQAMGDLNEALEGISHVTCSVRMH